MARVKLTRAVSLLAVLLFLTLTSTLVPVQAHKVKDVHSREKNQSANNNNMSDMPDMSPDEMSSIQTNYRPGSKFPTAQGRSSSGNSQGMRKLKIAAIRNVLAAKIANLANDGNSEKKILDHQAYHLF